MKRLVILFFLVLVGMFSQAQDDGSVKQKIKRAEQKKEQQTRNQQKAEVKGIKRHEAIQTKATRKRMHKHRKQRIHVEAYERKPFFLKRWFHKREH